MSKTPMSLSEIRQYHLRKKGIIKRRERMLDNLTYTQREIAEQMQDRYQLPTLEQAARYLDWYIALRSGWIDLATFQAETGLEAPVEA